MASGRVNPKSGFLVMRCEIRRIARNGKKKDIFNGDSIFEKLKRILQNSMAIFNILQKFLSRIFEQKSVKYFVFSQNKVPD